MVFMTIDEFLSTLQEAPQRGWEFKLVEEPALTLTSPDGSYRGPCYIIMAMKNGTKFPSCINAACNVATNARPPYLIDVAAREIGLTRADYRMISSANDGHGDYDKTLRNAILVACRLQEVHSRDRRKIWTRR